MWEMCEIRWLECKPYEYLFIIALFGFYKYGVGIRFLGYEG